MNRDGKYFNGITPVSRSVTCIVSTHVLMIYDCHTEELIATWNQSDIFHDENHNTAFVLGYKNDRSKIELFNLDVAKKIGIEEHSKKTVKKDLKAIYKWLGIVIVGALVFWFSIPVVSKLVAKRIPFEYEVKAASYMKINEYFKACSLTSEQEKALKLFSDFLYPKTELEKSMPIHFQVTNSPMINAYTFPGGKIILMKGLIKEVKSPEELLGIMGHEIGHVIARDSAGFIVRGSLLGAFFGYFTGDFSSSFAISPQIFLSTAALTFDRDMERAADAYSASRLNLMDVTTSGLRSFFSRRNYEDTEIAIEALMTHPENQSRIALIKETYPKTPLPESIVSSYVTIKTICDK